MLSAPLQCLFIGTGEGASFKISLKIRGFRLKNSSPIVSASALSHLPFKKNFIQAEMPEDSELQLFRCVASSKDEKHRQTYHLLIHNRNRAISHALIRGNEIDPSTFVSELTVKRPNNFPDLPLPPPFDQPDLGERIALSRASMAVGCDPNEWIKSNNPEYDLLIFLLAARRVHNAEAISKFIRDMQNHRMLSETFTKTLSEMMHGVYVHAFP
jgi:hypothetical protein